MKIAEKRYLKRKQSPKNANSCKKKEMQQNQKI